MSKAGIVVGIAVALVAGAAQATVAVRITQPASGATVGDALPPTVRVTDPLPDTVAHPALHVAASCTANGADACTSLEVHVVGTAGDTVLASVAAASIDRTLAL